MLKNKFSKSIHYEILIQYLTNLIEVQLFFVRIPLP